MYKKLLINDLRRTKTVSLSIVMFITASALLFALVVVLFANLTGSIDAMMTAAETPHFMQMHSGNVDYDRLEAFSVLNPSVEKHQIAEFVNMEANDILIEGDPLMGGIQDNGVVKQNDHFDFLLNLNGDVITVQPGQVYVPLSYMKGGLVKAGDLVDIRGVRLKVAGFLRDSQMNSPLSSSKRFLVSDSDFESLKPLGKTEYLIEFRLKDIEALSAFENQYLEAGLEANGPTVTYPLFRLINGLSDGLMIAVILLIAFLVLMIAFLCIRFTLLAKMEDDYREIGVLKAIGLHNGDIKRLYIIKYTAMAGVGCGLGLILSLALKEPLLADIKLYMGASLTWGSELMLSAASVLVIYVAVLANVSRVLSKIKKVSVTQALMFGLNQERGKMYEKFLLSRSRVMNSNLFLALKDVLGRKKLYMTMAAVILIGVFIMTVPVNLYNTISSESFISYMGVGRSDIRIDIQQTEDIGEKVETIAAALRNDEAIEEIAVLMTRAYVSYDANNTQTRLRIESGDHSVFPIQYVEGRQPLDTTEIALSVINAEELGVGVGDELVVVLENDRVRLKVIGLYSDITNGGKTAKALFDDPDTSLMWSTIAVDLADPSQIESVGAYYSDSFGYAKVTDIRDFVEETFGSTISAIGRAAVVGNLSVVIMTFFVILLFIKMLVSKDRYSIAIMKAVGHNDRDIMKQFLMRTVIVSLMSIAMGLVLSLTLGEKIAAMMISSYGAAAFTFEVSRVFTYLTAPVVVLIIAYAATVIGAVETQDMNIAQCIKE